MTTAPWPSQASTLRALPDGRWAVTGAAGEIGRTLRAHLAANGVAMRSLDVVACEPIGDDDDVRKLDLRNLDQTIDAVAGCVGIVHLGAISDEADFLDLVDVNVIGTYHVLEGARRGGVECVVVASSNRTTGLYDTETLVDPYMPPRPDGFYGVSKVAGEALCRLYTDKFNVRTVSLRIGTFADMPTTQRELRTWLSPADAMRAFDAAMRTDARTATFYAVSANAERWWTVEEGAAIGFVPIDEATTASGIPLEPMPRGTMQAGARGTAEFSLKRMRR